MPHLVKIGVRGGLGEHSVCHMFWFYPLFFLFYFCLCILRTASWPYRWTDSDARRLIGRVIRKGSAFWGIDEEK